MRGFWEPRNRDATRPGEVSVEEPIEAGQKALRRGDGALGWIAPYLKRIVLGTLPELRQWLH